MRFIVFLALLIMLVACGSTPPASLDLSLIQRQLPQPEHRPGDGLPDKDELLALPPQAKTLLDKEFKRYRRDPVARMKAFERWMAKPGGFVVLYDNEVTQLAAETYQKGAGNCMSLALLTAAFSNYLNLPFNFMRPDVPLYWEQREDIETINDHINVVVRARPGSLRHREQQAFLVDFSMTGQFRWTSQRLLTETEALSLFYRNRAAEALAQGELELAYSYGYEVMQRVPNQASSYSLLGVILRRQGELNLAEQVYRKGIALEPDNPFLLHNLVYMYRASGEVEKAQPYLARLEQEELKSPFVLGREAQEKLEQGDYDAALALYKRAIRKADYIHTFHFGKAKSLFLLGDFKGAQRALTKAKRLSTTLKQGEVYETKLTALASYL